MTAERLPDPATPSRGDASRRSAEGRAEDPAPEESALDEPAPPDEPVPPDEPAPPAEVLVAACFDEGPGYAVHRGRGAPNWLLTWTVNGAGVFRQQGVTVVTRPGDLVLAGPDLEHSYAVTESAGRWRFWWVHCQVRSHWMAWLRPFDRGGRLYVIGVPEVLRSRVEATFARLHGDARWSGIGVPHSAGSDGATRAAMARTTGPRELALNGVEEVLLLAVGAAEVEGRSGYAGEDGAVAFEGRAGIDPRVRRAEGLLFADPAASHTVDSLAVEVALSPSRLAHLFAAETGRSPMRALRDARLRQAARLLEVTNLTVASVAAASGFSSVHHFSRLFRDRFGVPPAHYRRWR